MKKSVPLVTYIIGWIYPVSADKEKAIEWIKAHPVFFAKPNDGACGKNIL